MHARLERAIYFSDERVCFVCMHVAACDARRLAAGQRRWLLHPPGMLTGVAGARQRQH